MYSNISTSKNFTNFSAMKRQLKKVDIRNNGSFNPWRDPHFEWLRWFDCIPSRIREYTLKEIVDWIAKRVVWALPMTAFVIERHLVIAWMILPFGSLRTIATTAKLDLTATSKLALIFPRREGLQREEDLASAQARLWCFPWFTLECEKLLSPSSDGAEW